VQDLSEWATSLPVERIPAALAQLAAASQTLAARLIAADTAAPPSTPGDDRLVEIHEAAQRTGLSVDYLYRHKSLPFRAQISRGQVRFSVKGIERWARARTGARY